MNLFGASSRVASSLLEGEGRLQTSVPLAVQIRDYVQRHDARRRYVQAATKHLEREREPRETDYDLVLVGGGVHAAAFVYTLRQSSPDLKVLITEKSSEVCSTFARLGDSLVLNSPTFTKVGLNSNIIQGHFVQVSDFDEVVERPFPTAKHLHELTTMVLFHADADIEFDFEVDDIEVCGEGYVVASRGRSVHAKSVVIANGMGAPKTRSFELDRRSEQVIYGDDFIRACFDDPCFLESVRDKAIAVVGDGDTANCVMEYLVPLVYPNHDYGFSSAPTLLPGSIAWVGQEAEGVREFFFANKRRYCHSGGVIELFWDEDEPLELPAPVWRKLRQTVRCIPERLLGASHAAGGLQLRTQTQTLEADLLIDCTGRFNPLSTSLLRRGYQFICGDITLHGGRWDESLESFTPSPRALEGRRIACQLKGERVFFVGSACPLCELIPDEEARDGSFEHQEHRISLTNSKWSLEHTLPRSVALAERFARDFL